MELGAVAVQPRLAQHMRPCFVAVMATGRTVAVGPVQSMALIAGIDPILVIPVPVIVPVQPP